MKKSVKGALLSGLVFPGTGQFVLGNNRRGLIFFSLSLTSLLYLIYYALKKAYALTEQIEAGTIPLDTVAITNLITAPPEGTDLLLLNLATWAILACWVGSIIDAYRLGNKADQSNNS